MKLSTLVTELSCPIDWRKYPVEPELGQWLDFLWFAQCHPHQVDGEVSSLFHYDDWRISGDELELLSAHEIQAALNNVRRWVMPIRATYIVFSRRFTALRAASKAVYAKHYAPPQSSISDLCTLSLQRSASVLVSQATPAVQTSLVWATLDDLVCNHMTDFDGPEARENPKPAAQYLNRLLDLDSLLVAVQFGRLIGATEGLSTTYGMIDFDFSTPQFHMYPISEREYQESTYKAYVHGWNFGLPQ